MNFASESQGLKTIKAKKHDLIDSIQNNLQRHIMEYEEALTGFKKHYAATVKNLLHDAEYNNKHQSSIFFDVPECHRKEYETIL